MAGSPYAITCADAAAANYSFTYVDGSLTVTPATLTVTADNETKTYGAANPTLTHTTTGFVNGETSAVVTTQPTCSTTATATSSVAGRRMRSPAAGGAAANYSFTYVDAALTITPATLTVTAENKSKVYGSANPPLTYVITGFQNGETDAVVTGTCRVFDDGR